MSASRRTPSLGEELPALAGFGVVGDMAGLLARRRPDMSAAANVWVSLAVAGGCLGTGSYASPWARRLRPNLNVLVVAPSGASKGDLFGDAEDLYDEAHPNHLLPSRFSAAALADEFVDRDHGLMVIDEGDELLRRTRQDAFADTTGMLCRAFDGRPTRERLRTRKATGPVPPVIAPTILMAIQPTALQDGVIDTGHMLSGLIARMVLVGLERPRSRTLLNDSDDQSADAWACVVEGLRRLATVAGAWSFSADARVWLGQLKSQIEAVSPIDELQGTWSRVMALGVKVSLILEAAMSGSDGARVISGVAMRVAVNLAAWSWAETNRIFATDVAFSRTEGEAQRVLRSVRGRGSRDVSRSDVLRDTRLSARQLDGVIETLIQRGSLTTAMGSPGPDGGRRPRLLSVTE